jgi:hypothetical protein
MRPMPMVRSRGCLAGVLPLFLAACGGRTGLYVIGQGVTGLDAAASDAPASMTPPSGPDSGPPDAESGTEDDAAAGADVDGCVPHGCSEFFGACGEVDDGCGSSIECGTCPSPCTCSQGDEPTKMPGMCVEPGTDGGPCCMRISCADLGYNCGMANDGCGGMQSCGTCQAPATCGGDGLFDVCGEPDGSAGDASPDA